jgi:NADH-quinone oxidoreductase subunit L
MVARMSPLFELSPAALNFVLFIGATTAFWTGLIGMVQNDIKRVVAYSTLSQLGYMTVALGVSAYSAGVYHLMTHAFFKALLFLGAGSVIIGMHHEQDMRRMGGLKKYMPITYWTMVIGTLALVGTPFFSGFFSKDTIIEAAAEHAHEADNWVATYAHWAVLLGAFVTSFYSFRLLYMTFHGRERFHDPIPDHYIAPEADSTEHEEALAEEHGHVAEDAHDAAHDAHDDHGHGHGHAPHESPWVVTLPLILLAIPSILIGFFTAGPDVVRHRRDGAPQAAAVLPGRDRRAEGTRHPRQARVGRVARPAGVRAAWLHRARVLARAGRLPARDLLYVFRPELPAKIAHALRWPIRVLERKYYMDDLWIDGFAGGGVALGQASRAVDTHVIDGVAVNGSARLVDLVSGVVRRAQSGYLYHYAFAMIVGLIVLLAVIQKYWTV